MDVKGLKETALELIGKYPSKKGQIVELYQLALDEIEEGGSEVHECELAHRDMLECIEDLEM